MSGKGVEAARRATFVRTALATFAGFVDEPCQLLELSNQVLVERAGPSTIFVTAVVAVLRPREGRLHVGLGRPPAAAAARQRRAAQRPQARAAARHRPHDHLPTRGSWSSRPSAGVLLFTDGVTEAHQSRQELFGERRLAAVVRELAGLPPDEVVRRLESAVLEHAGQSLRRRSLYRRGPRGDPVTDTFEPPPFGIELARDGATATVAVLGELDIATTPELTDALASLEPGYETLVVDLSRCTFFASSGISILLEESHRAKEEGFELVVIKAPPEVQRMFDLAGPRRQAHVPGSVALPTTASIITAPRARATETRWWPSRIA